MSLTGIRYLGILIVTTFGFVLIFAAPPSPTVTVLRRDVTGH